MRNLTTAHKNWLANPGRMIFLMEFELGATTHYICDADTNISWNGNTYLAGYLKEPGEIEVTQDVKIGDITPVIDATDSYFIALLLSESWMNKPVTVREYLLNQGGSFVTCAPIFDGLISDYSMSEDPREIELTVASVWADFEKESGIRTNSRSQNRFYPTDTAFEHSAQAVKNIPFGKEGNGVSGGGGSGSGKINPVFGDLP